MYLNMFVVVVLILGVGLVVVVELYVYNNLIVGFEVIKLVEWSYVMVV